MGSTSLIEDRKNGSDITKLPRQQQMFCLYMLTDENFDAKLAAEKAGYKHPGVLANKLMKKPAIKRLLGKYKRERDEKFKIKSEDVWRRLTQILFFDPIEIFSVGADGWLYVKNLEDIPPEVRQLIKEVDQDVIHLGEDGYVPKIKIKLMDKDHALSLAAKHAIPQEVNVNVGVGLDYDRLCNPELDDDPERRIETIEGEFKKVGDEKQ